MRVIILTCSSMLATLFFATIISFSEASPQKHRHHPHRHDREHRHDSMPDVPTVPSIYGNNISSGSTIRAEWLKNSSTSESDHTSTNSLQHQQTAVKSSFYTTPVSQAKMAIEAFDKSRSTLRARLERDLQGISTNDNVYTSFVVVTITVSPATTTATPSTGLQFGTSSSTEMDRQAVSSSSSGALPKVFKMADKVELPSTTSSASTSLPSSVCPAGNGTVYTTGSGNDYRIVCDINIANHDLPFQLVGSFDACIAKCDSTNVDAGRNICVAAIFVPGRVDDGNDCYLKYSLNDQMATTELVEAAILELGVSSSSQTSTVSYAASFTSVSVTASASSGLNVVYASGDKVVVPEVTAQHLQGPTQNHPTEQYLDYKAPPDLTLTKNLLVDSVQGDLTVDYGLSLDTGVLQLNSTTEAWLTNLKSTPHLSRDGGKGGYLNGQHLFVFSDTGCYTAPTDTTEGDFLSFVSSSCAVDTGLNALSGNAIYLEDGIGQWSDDVGRLRGFSSMTTGEEAYNLALQGDGYRYAIWPEASILSLDAETALLYAPIIFDVVNETTKVGLFTYTGNTLLTVTAGGKGGPIAERTVNRLFNQDEVEWGCMGGIRSWGPSGVGGTDGKVYIFGSVAGGLLLARTDHDGVADRSAYEYWTGNAWSSSMQAPSSTAYFFNGTLLDLDVFYSPRHLTFIIVYMSVYADSTFYYRYLQADQAILPPYAPGGDPFEDYVENLLKYDWSEEQVLYKASPGLNGNYIYAGGVHQGYYGASDITNGGSKMLLSWTAPTGQNPGSGVSEYQIITAEVDWA